MNIRLKNNYEFALDDGAALSNLVHVTTNEAAALAVCEQLTEENVESVEFVEGSSVVGRYEGLTFAGPTVRMLTDRGVEVHFSLREKTQIELAIEALKAEQEMQNEAIDYLAMQ